VSLLFTDDEHIAALNQRWRGRSGPTDVLSFAQPPGPRPDTGAEVLLGDVVIAVPTAARQAAAAHRSLGDELLALFAHGVLHLLGHDHVRPAQARRMFRAEGRLLALAGVAPDDPDGLGSARARRGALSRRGVARGAAVLARGVSEALAAALVEAVAPDGCVWMRGDDPAPEARVRGRIDAGALPACLAPSGRTSRRFDVVIDGRLWT
jgi:probable rRNA maturation factor